jgi:hypothetical protein
MPRILGLAALAALLAGTVAAAPAGAAARSKCQRLKGHDLAPAKTVKLVRRANADDGTDLVGCVLPRGRVRTVASSEDLFTTTYGYAIRQIAGRIVLLDSTYNSQYAFSQTTYVADVRSGRAYRLASQCFGIAGDDCSSGVAAVAPVAFVTKTGRAVAAVSRVIPGPGAPPPVVTIATFDPLGVRRDLDSGPATEVPAASLRLAGVNASWTHAGEPRVADISRPG